MPRRGITGFFIVLIVMLLASCAQVVPPNGGPKDTKPPVALSFSPENKSTHFSANKIVIKFNKYIQLKDITNQLVISPPLKRFPKITLVKGKELEILLKDTLQDNTTYTFNFGNSIADINEGNIAANFQYVVSTGNYLDSLKLIGQVKDAYTQAAQKDALVMLYANLNDSAPYKKLPSYCGRTDVNGNYLIEHLKAGSYRLFVLAQSQNGYIYHAGSEPIAYNTDTIKLTRNDTVNALLFLEEDPKKYLVKAQATERGKIMLVFNKPADSITVKPLNLPAGLNSRTLISYSVTRDTVNYWITGNPDSLRFIVLRGGKNEDTAVIYSFPGKVTKKDAKPATLKITSNAHNGQTDYDYHLPIIIKAEHPIAKYDLSRIIVTHRKDTIKYTVDSAGLPFILRLKCKLTSDSSYRFFIAPGSLTDVFGLKNDTLLSTIKIQEPTFFGTLKLNLTFAATGSYIIQLLDGSGNMVRQDIVTKAKSLFYDALPPGAYKIRAIKDDDGNGKWSAGNYHKKLQPEKVYYFPQPLTVRSNWDLNQDWIVK